MFFNKQLSKSLSFNFLHYVQKKIVLARLPRISANWTEKYRPYSFQTLANISRNFRKISGNIKFPENLQPCPNPNPGIFWRILQRCETGNFLTIWIVSQVNFFTDVSPDKEIRMKLWMSLRYKAWICNLDKDSRYGPNSPLRVLLL